jgi:hypothetical protein
MLRRLVLLHVIELTVAPDIDRGTARSPRAAAWAPVPHGGASSVSPGGTAGGSAQATYLLVYQDEYVFPLLLQQWTVDLPWVAASYSPGKQELLKFLYHWDHLLSNCVAREMGATINPSSHA